MRSLILGAAVSGRAAAGLALRLGHDVTAYDRDDRAAESLRALGVPCASGQWDVDLLNGVDVVVTSPGVPEHAPPIVDSIEAGIEVWSELEFGARHTTAPLLAVTGTNGKTSAVTAAALMLEASGAKVCAAGNIGTALSDVAADPWDTIVVEASSFQLRFTDTFHPSGAAILNVAPDHLDWHGTFEAYLAAKSRITANQGPGDILVVESDDAGAMSAAEGTAAAILPVSGSRLPEGGAGVANATVVAAGFSFPVPDLDTDFLADVIAAAALAGHGGATKEGIAEGMSSFRPGAHRRTTVGTWGDVRWVDDSKATNPHATVAAAAAYPSVVLIAGGRNKGLDLAPLENLPTVISVVTFGEAAGELARFVTSKMVTAARSIDDAVRKADAIARPGDTVLLAPACASFDMFSGYAERGDAFRRAVLALKGAGRGD